MDVGAFDSFAPRGRRLGSLGGEEVEDLAELGDRRVVLLGLQVSHAQAHVSPQKGNSRVADRLLQEGDSALGMALAGLFDAPLEERLRIGLEVRVGHDSG
ncbi:hypothetical protein D3C78_1694380 [compost metagenome]